MVLLTDTYGKMGFGGGSTPTGTKEITDTSLTNVADYANAQVVDANLVAGNIKKDVTVLGITGTHEGGITPTGTINITDTSLTDVTEYANAQVVDSDLVAGNIKKDVNILGVTGTFEGGGGAQYATGSFMLTSTVPSKSSPVTPYTIVDEDTIGFTPKVFVIKYSGSLTTVVSSAIMCNYEDGMWISATDAYYNSSGVTRHTFTGYNNESKDADVASLGGTLYNSNGLMIYNSTGKYSYYYYQLGEGTYTWYAYA